MSANNSAPLYPEYLPVRPEGFTPTLNVEPFETEEPGLLADPALPELFTSNSKITNITPRIGAEIEGVQLSQLTANGLDQVALFAAQRGVLVFRKQDFADIGTIKQKEIVSHFGPLHLHPTMGYPRGTGPEFHVVYTDDRTPGLRQILGERTSYDLWHIDQTFTPNTPSTTFFWILEIPKGGGGDTAFTSLTLAYKALSPKMVEVLSKLDLNHTSASVGEISRVGLERALKEAVKTTHPLIIEHPVTKEPVLFVNPTIAKSIVGMKSSESDLILNFLSDHIKSLDFSCRCRWEPGTVVVWDQVSVFISPDWKSFLKAL
ncbi:probable taurine catabolism dioxygenase [Rhynchosporium secalis]|uniref:Probable taurine catabolism dioxygenase n=1 Tax=Rhynchosporium secalis TaxID=38038 RepID=A0A1E1MI38_RHYSE|nr:probable taurine catabolism dioxygenase [Rhynchosporium secalis]